MQIHWCRSPWGSFAIPAKARIQMDVGGANEVEIRQSFSPHRNPLPQERGLLKEGWSLSDCPQCLSAYQPVNALRLDEDDHGFLVDHGLVVLLPVGVLGVAARHVHLAEKDSHLLGVGVVVVDERRLALD